jgi:fermentation-respiration switch protein FrsA (DUF1100 family)
MLLVVATLGILALWALQRRLIYFPDGSVPDPGQLPADWEPVSFDTIDGLELQAWYRRAPVGNPVVIVFHGNAGNRGDRVSLGTGLAAAGLGVLLTDYRGYGGNPGYPTEDGLASDARAAADFVKDRAPDSPIVYFGESLGAAVAVGLASVEPPAALVLRSPFTSMVAVARVHYPWLPASLLLKDRFPSLERIATIDAPTLVIAGEADATIPVRQSRDVFDAAPGAKQLIVISGADHNDAVLVSGAEVVEEIVTFIEREVE